MLDIVKDDLYRMTGQRSAGACWRLLFRSRSFRHLFFFRGVTESKNPFAKKMFHFGYHLAVQKSGVELPLSVTIGRGCQFLHPYGITINSLAKIGKNLTMLKGATIGNIKCGKRAGTPIIGDDVYIGLNSSVVGGITIGNDVLIAANTFVNFDVPDHSVVVGSPGVLHHKKNATVVYINNRVEA